MAYFKSKPIRLTTRPLKAVFYQAVNTTNMVSLPFADKGHAERIAFVIQGWTEELKA